MTPYYDGLLGKLAVCAGTREEALRKLRAALCELVIEGVDFLVMPTLGLILSFVGRVTSRYR